MSRATPEDYTILEGPDGVEFVPLDQPSDVGLSDEFSLNGNTFKPLSIWDYNIDRGVGTTPKKVRIRSIKLERKK